MGNKLYNKLVTDLSNKVGNAICPEQRETAQEDEEMSLKYLFDRGLSLAQDLGLWITYLSKREGIIGSQVRKKLESLGITNPDALASDIEKIKQNALKVCDSLL